GSWWERVSHSNTFSFLTNRHTNKHTKIQNLAFSEILRPHFCQTHTHLAVWLLITLAERELGVQSHTHTHTHTHTRGGRDRKEREREEKGRGETWRGAGEGESVCGWISKYLMTKTNGKHL